MPNFNPADLDKIKYIKHPYNKKRLIISDIFESSKNFTCANCGSIGRPTVNIIEPDSSNIANYLTIECKGCGKTSWYIKEKS